MSDEKLRLEAQLRDNMSPGLRKIKDQLQAFRMTPGMQAVSDHMKQLSVETAKFATFGGSAATAMGALGIGGLAAAGSLAGVAEQMKRLGQSRIALKELARETGVSANWLNVWSHAGLHFGVSADAMKSALSHLSAQMPQFENKTSALYGLMAAKWPTLTEKLLGEDSEHQLNDIIKFLGQLKNQPQLQKQLASEFFGNGDDIEKLFKNGADGFWAEFKKQQKQLNPINPELLKQSQKFLDATIKFKDTLENFENSAGPLFLKTMGGIVGEATDLVKLLEGPKANGGWLSLWKKGLDMTTLGQFEERVYKDIQDKLHGGSKDAPKAETPHNDNGSGALQGQDEFRKKLNESLQNSNPLFHKSAFITRSDLLPRDSGLEGIIAGGTKSGVIAAFREMMAIQDADRNGGFINASYESAKSAGRAIRRHEEAPFDVPSGPAPKGSSAGSLTKLMDATSRKYGLDPRILEGIRAGESGHRSNYDIGDRNNGPAYGPLQLNVGRGRLGWRFERETHLDLRDPRTIPAQIDWVAKYIRKRLAENSHYNPGREWFGFHGLRSADPRWGDSGYRPDVRRATGLSPHNTAAGAGTTHTPPQGHIRADIHVHGNPHKATVKGSGVDVTLHRWPVMSEAI